MIRVVIADDEPLARKGLRLRLARHPELVVVGEAADGEEAVRLATGLTPDLMLLDVQMPRGNGFDVLRQLADVHVPAIIFVTAYDRYALDAFEVDAVDYLLKPFTEERFEDALARARRELARRDDDDAPPSFAALLDRDGPHRTRIAVRAGDRYILVPMDTIDWIAAAENYVEIHAAGRTYLHRTTIAGIEARLDPGRFTRIHRSTIVNVDRVAQIRSDAHGDFIVTLSDGTGLKMTRRYREALLGRG